MFEVSKSHTTLTSHFSSSFGTIIGTALDSRRFSGEVKSQLSLTSHKYYLCCVTPHFNLYKMINDTTMIKERRRNRERSSSHSAYTTCSESTTGLRGEGGAGIPRSTKDIAPTSAMVIKTQEQSLQCNGIHKRHRQPIIDRCTRRVHTCSSVDFSHATVRLHSMILGDNPACTDGPPITISWNCNQELTYAIPHDEVKCQNDIKKVPDDLQLTSEERIDILQRQGFTFGEIQRCILKTNCERAERIETVQRLTQRNVLARFKNFMTPKREKNKSKEDKIATSNI